MTPAVGLLLAVLLHPVHETVAELEWNPQTGRLEVALRLSVLDEQWIGRQFPAHKEVAMWAIEYLKRYFQIDPDRMVDDAQKENRAIYHWLGRQQQGSHVWWYFEIEPPDKVRPNSLAQRLLFDCDRNYVHRVIVLGQKTRQAVTLTASKSHTKLQFDADSHDSPADR